MNIHPSKNLMLRSIKPLMNISSIPSILTLLSIPVSCQYSAWNRHTCTHISLISVSLYPIIACGCAPMRMRDPWQSNKIHHYHYSKPRQTLLSRTQLAAETMQRTQNPFQSNTRTQPHKRAHFIRVFDIHNILLLLSPRFHAQFLTIFDSQSLCVSIYRHSITQSTDPKCADNFSFPFSPYKQVAQRMRIDRKKKQKLYNMKAKIDSAFLCLRTFAFFISHSHMYGVNSISLKQFSAFERTLAEIHSFTKRGEENTINIIQMTIIIQETQSDRLSQ